MRDALTRYLDNLFSWDSITSTNEVYATEKNPVTGKDDVLSAEIYESVDDPFIQNRWAVVIAHGGGFEKGTPAWMAWMSTRFAMMGFAVFNISYRITTLNIGPLYGGADMETAVAWVRDNATRLRVDPQKVIVFGESAGHISAMMNYKNDLAPYKQTVYQSSGRADLITGYSGALKYNDPNWPSGPVNWDYTSEIEAGEPAFWALNSWNDTVVPRAFFIPTRDAAMAALGLLNVGGGIIEGSTHKIFQPGGLGEWAIDKWSGWVYGRFNPAAIAAGKLVDA